MNAEHTLKQFFHRPVRVKVKFPGADRDLVSFIEDEDEGNDSYEAEVKRMIELCGMVTPQYDAVSLESWD